MSYKSGKSSVWSIWSCTISILRTASIPSTTSIFSIFNIICMDSMDNMNSMNSITIIIIIIIIIMFIIRITISINMIIIIRITISPCFLLKLSKWHLNSRWWVTCTSDKQEMVGILWESRLEFQQKHLGNAPRLRTTVFSKNLGFPQYGVITKKQEKKWCNVQWTINFPSDKWMEPFWNHVLSHHCKTFLTIKLWGGSQARLGTTLQHKKLQHGHVLPVGKDGWK